MGLARVSAKTIVLLLTLLTWQGARCERKESDGCINSFKQLEQSVISRDSNMDSLMDAFYPPNRQASTAVNVYYFYETDGPGYMTSYEHTYTFRWAASPVFELIRPELLQHLSLYLYHGHTTTAKITITPLCDVHPQRIYSMTLYDKTCREKGNTSDPVLLMNKLTTHLKGYVKDNRLLGVDEENRGYSSFLSHNNTNDHCVIGQAENYMQIRILVFLILSSLTILSATVLPLTIFINYKKIHNMIEEGRNRLFYLRATIILLIVLEIAVISLDVWIASDGVKTEILFVDVWWYYAICLVITILLPLGNFVSAIVVGYKWKNDIAMNPIPCPVPVCFTNNVTKSSVITYIIHCAMISVIVLGVQLLLIIHGYFISLALIASPVYTTSLLLLCVAGFYCFVTLITLMLKTLNRKFLPTFFVCVIGTVFLTTLCLSIIAFVKFTMLVGEYHNSGGILAVVARSLGPTLILTFLGKLGGKALTLFGYSNAEPTLGGSSNSRVVASKLALFSIGSKEDQQALLRRRDPVECIETIV